MFKIVGNDVLEPEGSCAHDCDWVHDYDPNSLLGDAYYCARCGQLMQVG